MKSIIYKNNRLKIDGLVKSVLTPSNLHLLPLFGNSSCQMSAENLCQSFALTYSVAFMFIDNIKCSVLFMLANYHRHSSSCTKPNFRDAILGPDQIPLNY